MWRIIKGLFTGDFHLCIWEDKEVVRLVYNGDTNGYTHHCKCTVCGKHKSFTNWN